MATETLESRPADDKAKSLRLVEIAIVNTNDNAIQSGVSRDVAKLAALYREAADTVRDAGDDADVAIGLLAPSALALAGARPSISDRNRIQCRSTLTTTRRAKR